MIVWGERLGRGDGGAAAIDSLLELAEGLGCAGSEGSGLLEVPDVDQRAAACARSGCLPDAGPGPRPRPTAGTDSRGDPRRASRRTS